MSNDNTGARDPRKIESDLERNRERMDHTLDILQHKFTPGELFDSALNYARAKSDDGSSSRLKDIMVRNPLPVTLIGVGVAWLLLAGRDGSVPHQDTARGAPDIQQDTTPGSQRAPSPNEPSPGRTSDRAGPVDLNTARGESSSPAPEVAQSGSSTGSSTSTASSSTGVTDTRKASASSGSGSAGVADTPTLGASSSPSAGTGVSRSGAVGTRTAGNSASGDKSASSGSGVTGASTSKTPPR